MQHLQYSLLVQYKCSIYVQRNKTKQWYSFLLLTPLIRDIATRQNSPSLRNGSMERRATEKVQSKIHQLLYMWRIEHEELQKQKIREQPGFVPPSRLGTNNSERIATEIKELTAARLARFSAVNTSYGD